MKVPEKKVKPTPIPQLLTAGPYSGSKPIVYATDVTMVDWVAKDMACAMLQGIMQCNVYKTTGKTIHPEQHPDPELLAKNAYVLADAFVAEKVAREETAAKKLEKQKPAEQQIKEQGKQ